MFQGLSSDPAEDTYLGKLVLDDIPIKPAGEVCVAVSFMLNDQGRLRIVSSIEGRDREEELVIDNIFDVSDADSEFSSGKRDAKEYLDDFEESFMPLLSGNAEAAELFKRRRTAIESGDTDTAEECEASLFSLLPR